MTPTCHIGSILLAQSTGLDFLEPVFRWAETLSLPDYIALGAVGILALLIGTSISRSKSRVNRHGNDAPSGSGPNAELIWRHEKLVLLERQDQEKQMRIIHAIDEAFSARDSRGAEIRMRLLRISETLRDVRQRVGSDLSRLNLVQDRLDFLSNSGIARPGAVNAALEIADAHASRLEEVREQLRPVTKSFLDIEAGFSAKESLTTGSKEFRDSLLAARKRLDDLPSDWQTLTDEADRKISELLGDDPSFDGIQNVLLVDGAVTSSLEKSDDGGPRRDVDAILTLLDKKPDLPARSANPFDPPAPKSPSFSPKPDAGFRAPATLPVTSNGSSRKDSEPQDTAPAEESDSGEEGEIHPPLVVFRSNDPDLWGKDVYRGTNSRAREMSVTPGWANWISISRVDTGEIVYAPASTIGFSNDDFHSSTGFNASHELFYGARHLGMFSETVPNEVETRFTYGGWGFGHRVSENGDDSESAQASGWAGKEISADTVFEVVLHEELPDNAETEQVLHAAEPVLTS